jgi:hypothetical protein
VSFAPDLAKGRQRALFLAATRIWGHHHVSLAALSVGQHKEAFYEIHFDMDNTARCSGCHHKKIS